MKSSKTTAKPTGYILHETDTIAVIATIHSENIKTGDMIQVWILNRHESPVEAVRSGQDETVCFDCPHRGDGFNDRTCYVNVAQGPNAVYRAYRANKYPTLPIARYAEVFSNRKVRFGAYGEPVLIPLHIVEAIAQIADGHTGYTHQWRKTEYQAYGAYLMASCDSPRDSALAEAMGWRHFRVRNATEALLPGEISCPASDEMGKRTTCDRCTLCNGKRTATDARKNIAIIVHGIGAKNFVALEAIAPIAIAA